MNTHRKFDSFESDAPLGEFVDTLRCPQTFELERDTFAKYVHQILENGDADFEGNLFGDK